jgi:hypothetical protein
VSLSRMKSVNTFQTSPGFPCWYKRGSHLMSLTEMERFSASSQPLIAFVSNTWMDKIFIAMTGKWHEFILVLQLDIQRCFNNKDVAFRNILVSISCFGAGRANYSNTQIPTWSVAKIFYRLNWVSLWMHLTMMHMSSLM